MARDTAANLRSSPAYGPLVRDLRDAIASGRLADGDRINGEVALAEQYGISVTSVRSGIEILVGERLLRRKRGSGTYVTHSQIAPAGAEASIVRRDTIVSVSILTPVTYHPYYSERAAGLRAGLAGHGLKLWELGQDSAPQDDSWDYIGVPHGWDLSRLWRDLVTRPGLAGIMTSAALIPKSPDWQPSTPVVSPDLSSRVSCVAYDWTLELEGCIRMLLEQGCRHLWVAGVFDDERLQSAAARAAGALGVEPPALTLRQTDLRVRSYSASARTAYQVAHHDFVTEQSALACDGVLVTSDFETEGVMDAMREAGCLTDRPFVAMVNKESRLHLPRDIIRVVIDGYRQGDALADMLAKQIIRPASAPRRVILRAQIESY